MINPSSLLPGSASSQRDCCRAEATWSCPGTQGPTAGAGTFSLEEAPHENAGLSRGRCVVVLGPLRGTKLYGPGNLLHVLQGCTCLRTQERTGVYIIIWLERYHQQLETACLSFSLLTFRVPVTAPARTQLEDSWQESSKWDSCLFIQWDG